MAIPMIPKSGELVVLPPPSLSAREFIIYQYGIVILKFLRSHIGVSTSLGIETIDKEMNKLRKP